MRLLKLWFLDCWATFFAAQDEELVIAQLGLGNEPAPKGAPSWFN
jgi:hypothetical protein